MPELGCPWATAIPEPMLQHERTILGRHPAVHRRFTGGSCVVLWGGGMKRGFLYGKSAPERPFMAIKNPLTVTDLHATIFTALGISPQTAFEVEKRPFYATSDGKGLWRREFVCVMPLPVCCSGLEACRWRRGRVRYCHNYSRKHDECAACRFGRERAREGVYAARDVVPTSRIRTAVQLPFDLHERITTAARRLFKAP